MNDIDLRVRLAAFGFLEELQRRHDLLPRTALAEGFTLDGVRVPLVGPQGIFKPRLCSLPLSITTVPIAEGQPRPCDDAIGEGFASLGSVPDLESPETDIRRRYVTRQVQQRLHQTEFRERVLAAYRRHYAVCRLKRDRLLEAAHIVADREERGVPVVPNGISLCALHHSAFDAHLIAVTPDYQVEVRQDVLDEADGPMLIHGLQGFHGQEIRLPRRERDWPDRELLEERYAVFLTH